MVRCLRCASLCGDAHRYCHACGAPIEPAVAEAEDDPLLGRTLPGGYRVTSLVGVGGMGRVYCAEQVALGRTVAVKVVHPHLVDDELAAARFLNEARAASRLSHPNSVAIFDFGRTDDRQPYIVMEYLRGRDLGRVAYGEGPLPLRRVVDILRQALAALDEAHALGILHRDLKPDNIVLEPLRSGLDFVKVVDFGLAKLITGEAPPSLGRALTRPGLVCGTPEYMSPEQARGDDLDGRSDLYAVGVLLFELLAGCQPFSGDSPAKTLLAQLTQPPPDPRAMAPERAIPAPFAELVLRALAKPREDRLQTARAFAEALGQALVEGEGRQAVGSARTTVVRCDQCGGVSPIGQKFCGDCGWCIAPVPSGSAFSDRATTPITDDARSTAPTVSIPPVKEVESLPFVAREEVIRWLEERHDESAFTTASAHLVGEAGIGKTRLLREVVARWTARGDIVVVVEPDPAWAKVADAAVRTAVRKLAGWADGPPPPGFLTSASHEAGLGLGLLFDAREPSGLSARERQAALADALRWGIERARQRAGGNRVVVALDDLDFVDGTSRRAFADLLAERSSAPLLLVVTYASAVPPFGAPAAGEMWQLEELPYEAFAGHVSPGLATRGEPLSPLHVDQLLAWARETCEPAPARLADLIASRVERLSTEARHVLYGLAVWGDDAEFPTLQRLLPDAADVRGGRDELEKAGWLARSELGVRIAHPLVRRVVLATIPAGRKSELFASAGGLQPEAPLEVRARHATYGGNAFEALSLLDALSARRSAHGDLAGSVSALRQALELARRELHRDGLDDPVTAILIFSRKLAEALAADGRWSDAEGVLHEALGTAPPTSEHRARLLGVMAEIANVRRHPGEARRYLEEAMRVAYQSDARALFPILDRIDKAIAVA